LGIGLRYSIDKVRETLIINETVDVFAGPPAVIIPAQPAISGRVTSKTLTPRVSATYELSDDINVYGVISKGARPGGTNLEAFAVPNSGLPTNYGVEKVWNYEAGFKGSVNNDLTFSLSAFHLSWSGLQAASRVFTAGNVVGTNVTLSAGKARTWGAELEYSARLSDRVRIDGAFGWLDAKFVSFSTVDDLGNNYNASGNQIPIVSKFMGAIAAQYTHPVSDQANIFIRGEGAYRSGFWENVLNADTTLPRVKGYETVSLRAGAEIDRFSLTFFGENITNNRVNIGAAGGVGGVGGLPATVRPTRWGVTAAVDF
jgi:iron complex outermembrane recepter protein